MTPDLLFVIYGLACFTFGVFVGHVVIPWLYDTAQAFLGPRER